MGDLAARREKSQAVFDGASPAARAYVAAALALEEGEDDIFDPADIHPDSLRGMVEDADGFVSLFRADIEASEGHALSRAAGTGWSVDELAGNDLFLTSNGHGAGFWDGGWPEPHASRLDEGAKAVGVCELYRGDDGLVYRSGSEPPALRP